MEALPYIPTEASAFTFTPLYTLATVKLCVSILTPTPSAPVCPQWSGSGPGSLREAAALQPAEVQLLPLRPGPVRPAGPARGDREDLLRGLHREGEGLCRDDPLTALFNSGIIHHS